MSRPYFKISLAKPDCSLEFEEFQQTLPKQNGLYTVNIFFLVRNVQYSILQPSELKIGGLTRERVIMITFILNAFLRDQLTTQRGILSILAHVCE